MKISRLILDNPKTVIILCLLPIAVSLAFIPHLVQDLRSDAFLADDNPALVYKRKVKEEFGLSDPLVVAIVNESPSGIYNSATLGFLQELTSQISDLPNIDASRVVSLATEQNIYATEEGMEISPFLEEVPGTQAKLDALRQAVNNFPMYVGNLVSADGKVTLIIAEMVDEGLAGESYQNIVNLVATTNPPPDIQVHLAGEGAIIGYLGGYVDADARQLVPFCGLVIALILVLAYRSILPAIFTFVIVAATLIITVGTMSAAGVPFYVITNALPIILIGIAVADAIHIYIHYFELQRQEPDADVKVLVGETIAAMWRPISLTSLTTAAGFLGLYLSGYMPPFKYFGLFCALGVMIAWCYSLTFLPAVIVLTKPQPSRGYSDTSQKHQTGTLSRLLGSLAELPLRYFRIIIGVYFILAVAGLYAAGHLVVDENPINVFNPKEPVVLADRIINRHLNGANTLDIVIETPNPEDLFIPENLRKMEALQEFVSSLPEVGGSISIVDYLKQMNRSLNDGNEEEYRLPATKEMVAQYFLMYAAMSDPTDFEEEVDYNYQTANIRVYVKSGDYTDVKVIIESLEPYLEEHFSGGEISASLSGRVNVHYRWISELARSHFIGLALAISLVLIVSSFLFRSLVAGLLTLLPVGSAVLLVYALMGWSGISLGMGTSMFAAVAIGLGIDYSIHTLERIRSLYMSCNESMEATFRAFYPTTGRALFYNFFSIAGGFAVLMLSKISSLNIFGAVVVLAVSASFVASLTLLPSILQAFVPRFLRRVPGQTSANTSGHVRSLLVLVAFLIIVPVQPILAQAGQHALSPDELMEMEPAKDGLLSSDKPTEIVPGLSSVPVSVTTGDELVELINAVPEGQQVRRRIDMTMTDRHGKQRSRTTASFSKTYDDQKKTVLFYLAPSNVRDTGFLIWDYTDPEEVDDQWLYLPALRRVRRISAADRGDYFLGTDFTYEDIKLDGKLEPQDYTFVLMERENVGEIEAYKLEATPKSNAVATELGYSRTLLWVDPTNWMILRAEFWDVKERALKILTVSDIRQTDGIWTRHKLLLENLQTGHRTEFLFSEVDYSTGVPDDMFTKASLERGY